MVCRRVLIGGPRDLRMGCLIHLSHHFSCSDVPELVPHSAMLALQDIICCIADIRELERIVILNSLLLLLKLIICVARQSVTHCDALEPTKRQSRSNLYRSVT